MARDDLDRIGAVWERAAVEDPYFAVLSDPGKRGGRWNAESFFRSGEAEVDAVLTYLSSRTINVRRDGTALDFGCGLGRLTGPLARRFQGAVGVDVSATMLAKARSLAGDNSQVEFVHNTRNDLSAIEDARFAFVYSNIVLQHLPRRLAMGYVKEFLRVTRPSGVVVFQIPDSLRLGMVGRLRKVIRLRTRLASLGRASTAGSAEAVEWEMHGTPEREVLRWVADGGERVCDIAITNATDPTFNGALRYLDATPARGWVSRQYCVVKASPAPADPPQVV